MLLYLNSFHFKWVHGYFGWYKYGNFVGLFTLLSHQFQSHPKKQTFADLFQSYTATDCIEYPYTRCRHYVLVGTVRVASRSPTLSDCALDCQKWCIKLLKGQNSVVSFFFAVSTIFEQRGRRSVLTNIALNGRSNNRRGGLYWVFIVGGPMLFTIKFCKKYYIINK